MLQPVSVALKFGFLAVLYLFLLWVAWVVIRDMRRASRGRAEPSSAPPSDATRMFSAVEPMEAEANGFEPQLFVERASGHEAGTAYDLGQAVTLGRGDVEIQLDDPFASSRHARISRQGNVLVIEDLGSTNGTYLNEEPLSGPQPLHPGDRIRIGDSEFSYRQ